MTWPDISKEAVVRWLDEDREMRRSCSNVHIDVFQRVR